HRPLSAGRVIGESGALAIEVEGPESAGAAGVGRRGGRFEARILQQIGRINLESRPERRQRGSIYGSTFASSTKGHVLLRKMTGCNRFHPTERGHFVKQIMGRSQAFFQRFGWQNR